MNYILAQNARKCTCNTHSIEPIIQLASRPIKDVPGLENAHECAETLLKLIVAESHYKRRRLTTNELNILTAKQAAKLR